MRHDRTTLLLTLLLLPALLLAEEDSDAQVVEPTLSGREVVIKPDAEKLKERGLTVDAFRTLCEKRRYSEDALDFEFQGKRIALKLVADVSIRDVQAPPFSVALPDGRMLKLIPNPKAIAQYCVPGRYFEEDVRRTLDDLFLPDPLKVSVLAGIPVPGGQIPNAWGADHVHISIGEPIAKFASVEITGEKGPQAAELQRMQEIHRVLDTIVNREVGVTRDAFQKTFGAGVEQPREPNEGHFKSIPGWEFKLATGRLTLWYDDAGKIRDISAYTGPLQLTHPRDYRADANARATLDFEFLCAFLTAKRAHADETEKKKLVELLKAARSWTDAEWAKLGNEK